VRASIPPRSPSVRGYPAPWRLRIALTHCFWRFHRPLPSRIREHDCPHDPCHAPRAHILSSANVLDLPCHRDAHLLSMSGRSSSAPFSPSIPGTGKPRSRSRAEQVQGRAFSSCSVGRETDDSSLRPAGAVRLRDTFHHNRAFPASLKTGRWLLLGVARIFRNRIRSALLGRSRDPGRTTNPLNGETLQVPATLPLDRNQQQRVAPSARTPVSRASVTIGFLVLEARTRRWHFGRFCASLSETRAESGSPGLELGKDYREITSKGSSARVISVIGRVASDGSAGEWP